jgi:hypothetical protein
MSYRSCFDSGKQPRLYMLQIATGKLFRGPTLMTNHLRGVLFSNLDRLPKSGILTSAGKLGSVDVLQPRSSSFIYEIKELIEGDKLAPGMIAGYGVDRYQKDFSALVSFFLQVTCSPDHSLVSRLTSGTAGLATGVPPKHLVRRVFDTRVAPKDDEWKAFARWIDELLGLERATYLVVMQAIRTLVTGLHRMGDDLEVAYTLMVAALEAMAMKFDGHETSWEDVDERKRSEVDTALSTADAGVASAVRGAIAKHEHVLLRRRFKAFVLATVPGSFFGGDADASVAPPGRLDLGDALDVAYEIRSKYVHALERLPQELTGPRGRAEQILLLDRRTAITFQGLFRVARAAIIEFVRRQPKTEKGERPGAPPCRVPAQSLGGLISSVVSSVS